MESGDTQESKNSWTTVGGKKPVAKKDKSSENLSGGIFGQTKASVNKAAAQSGPAAVKKPEAIRIREEQLNRLKKKTAPLPEAMTKRSESDSDSSDKPRGDSSQRAKDKKSQNQPPHKTPAKPGMNLQAALKKVDYKALSADVQKSKTANPTGDAWMKVLATQLNDKLKEVPSEASFYAEDGFAWRYPLSIAPKELTNLLDSAFKSAPNDVLEGYLDWLITDATRQSISKKNSIYGYQLVIQYLLSKNPELITEKNLNSRVSDLKSYASRKDETIKEETLAVLWAYGQAGISSFEKGFNVWYKLMFPLLSDRRYTALIVAYLTKLLENHKKPSFGKDLSQAEVFLNIFDHFLGRNTIHFHKSTKAKLTSSYEHLKNLLFRGEVKEKAASYFAQFLMRLGQTQQPEPYHRAAAENIMTCLKTDNKCLDVWRSKHESSLQESYALLKYILENNTHDTQTLRRSAKFTSFLDGVAEFEPSAKKEVPESFADENAQAIEIAKKLKRHIKSEARSSGIKKFFLFIVLVAAAVGGEIMYNTPKGSYAVQGYQVAKPVAIKYWTIAKPAVIHGWEEYVKPFSYWAAVESVQLVKYSFNLACNLWASFKTNVPQAYGALLLAQDYVGQLTSQLGSLCVVGLRKLDHALLDMPPLSQFAEKALPLVDFAREKLASSLVYVGHLVEHYIQGNATASDKTK